MDNTLARLSVAQLKKATTIKERIEALEGELSDILGDSGSAIAVPATGGGEIRKRRKMSPEAREKIAAAQRARWAKVKAKKK
jgi:hypothetical protein